MNDLSIYDRLKKIDDCRAWIVAQVAATGSFKEVSDKWGDLYKPSYPAFVLFNESADLAYGGDQDRAYFSLFLRNKGDSTNDNLATIKVVTDILEDFTLGRHCLASQIEQVEHFIDDGGGRADVSRGIVTRLALVINL